MQPPLWQSTRTAVKRAYAIRIAFKCLLMKSTTKLHHDIRQIYGAACPSGIQVQTALLLRPAAQ